MNTSLSTITIARYEKELISPGVPYSVMYLDFAVFRAFEFVVRCELIFGQELYFFKTKV